jgi:hypothetical protein
MKQKSDNIISVVQNILQNLGEGRKSEGCSILLVLNASEVSIPSGS